MELSIDTSTEIAGVALSQHGVPRTELTWTVGRNHTTQLLSQVDCLLNLGRIEMHQLEFIFVAVGPGAFNGIRAALSTAKGFAVSLTIPLVGISTLEVEAFPFACTRLPVVAIHDANRSELATASYQVLHGEWHCTQEERLTTIETLCADTSVPTVFCGEIPAGVESVLRQRLAGLAVIPDASARMRRTGHLAALAWRRLQQGSFDDPATLQPIYMRRPHITIPKNHQ